MTSVFLLTMGGCFAALSEQPESIDRSQVAGTWIGDGGARVELRVDGGFEMSGIPRSALHFSFIDPPPGEGKLSGSGTWELGPHREGDSVENILLYVDTGGSFSDDSEVEELRVAESGEKPVLYFFTSPEKWYGFEVRKTGT
ncbi:hypothetical protein [Streptomyces sp. NPDC058326]|uniref:hypothetical protein n=1 Tax=Streptomyces sp. NPDC058326 TaxID=3346447 RepID=UPI0036E05CC2